MRQQTKRWKEDEVALLLDAYPVRAKAEVESLFPQRGWAGIDWKGRRLGLDRQRARHTHPGQKPIKQFSEHERSLIAWSIAWEGSIGIHQHASKESRKGFWLVPKIGLSNTEENLIRQFYRIVDCGGLNGPYPDKRRVKPIWYWHLTSVGPCYEFLQQVIDHLPDKRKRAKLVLRFCELRMQNWNSPYSNEEIRIHQEVRFLNHRRGLPFKL